MDAEKIAEALAEVGDAVADVELVDVKEDPKAAKVEPKKERKKPGRPPKKSPSVPIKVHGIKTEPINEGDVLELVYYNPALFKKILTLQKSFNVSEVEFIFDPHGVRIVTKDHLKKSTIYITIDGRCMNMYYCKEVRKICVKRDDLEKIMSTLGRTHSKITFLLKEDYRKILYIIVNDTEYENEDIYEVDVFCSETKTPEIAHDDTDYPLKFKLSGKHFKAKLNNLKKMSTTFTIQHTGGNALQITFDKAPKINYTGTYIGDKIELKSTLEEDDIFSVSVVIDYIKPFSNSNIGEEVLIAADKTRPMSFMTRLDHSDNGWAACVKIFTEIKVHRKPVPVVTLTETTAT
jgi:hypothetical protein